MPDRALSTPLADSFKRYLQDKGKGRGGDGGNYRRNASRELERFAEWAAGDRGDDNWSGIVPDDVDRDPVISPLQSYHQLMDPPTVHWPAFPTFDQRTLAGLVKDELADRGESLEAIIKLSEEYARDLLLALDEDIRPPSITTDGARSILQRLSEARDRH